MHCSGIKQLWKGNMNLDELKLIDLSGSQNLIEIPDLSGAPKLKQLILRHCTRLYKIHSSLGDLKQLIRLDLNGCKCLTNLPHKISLEALEIFNLGGCLRLKKFPKIVLILSGCSKLNELPENLGNIKEVLVVSTSADDCAVKPLGSSAAKWAKRRFLKDVFQLKLLLIMCSCISISLAIFWMCIFPRFYAEYQRKEHQEFLMQSGLVCYCL
nr:isoform 1 of protein suppressor of npr1-1, constitutive 1 [Quercus suber]